MGDIDAVRGTKIDLDMPFAFIYSRTNVTLYTELRGINNLTNTVNKAW